MNMTAKIIEKNMLSMKQKTEAHEKRQLVDLMITYLFAALLRKLFMYIFFPMYIGISSVSIFYIIMYK